MLISIIMLYKRTSLKVLKACNQMKSRLGQISNYQPTPIITNVMATISHEIQSCLSQKDPLR